MIPILGMEPKLKGKTQKVAPSYCKWITSLDNYSTYRVDDDATDAADDDHESGDLTMDLCITWRMKNEL